MRDWFNGLQPRERLILGSGAVAAGLIIVWGLIWLPVRSGSLELRDTVAEKQRLLTDLQRAELVQPGDATGGGPIRTQSLMVLIDRTARSSGLAFTRTRQDGPDGMSVSFERTSFDGILSWLIALERDHGISVESASFNMARERGLVTGQIFLRGF